MRLDFIPVITEHQIADLADLAKKVWNEYFVSILIQDQIDYMVDKFQSMPAMTEQIQNQGYQYYFLNLEGKNIGYIGVREETGKLFLSKLYIVKEYRGKGFASEAFEFLENMCQNKKIRAIWLTVNRYNEDTIHIYEKKGFQTIRTHVMDIGEGYVMDDFVMEKIV